MEIVQHFHRLSQLNYAVDEGLYPLGSCTMKYNPRINEQTARLVGLAAAHPLQPVEQVQGCLRLIWELEQALIAITGMAGVTLQPAAGAHGELAGILMIRKALEARGDARDVVLVPDSAHGTNPATAAFAGYETIEIASGADGTVDLEELDRLMTDRVAGIMLTVPNTLGVFEHRIVEISEARPRPRRSDLHGRRQPQRLCRPRPARSHGRRRHAHQPAQDLLHAPRRRRARRRPGGRLRGPGAAPAGTAGGQGRRSLLALIEDDAASIGAMRGFYGNFLILVRALTYIRSLGSDGLRQMSDVAVLYANLIRRRLGDAYHLPYDSPTLHEVVFDDTRQTANDVHNTDIAKRLLDYGFHPPTMSFPLIVHGALMIEPTESVSPDEIDVFCDAMLAIAKEAEENPELVRSAPHDTPVSRVDEVRAAQEVEGPVDAGRKFLILNSQFLIDIADSQRRFEGDEGTRLRLRTDVPSQIDFGKERLAGM